MKSIIWKEFRETVWWALLLALIFTVAQLYPLFFASTYVYAVSSYQGFGMLDSTYLLVTLFGAAGIGLILGFLQILPERNADRWATLLHRPMPPETVLLSKLIAGTGAYVLAVAPAFLLVLYLVLTPGFTAYPSVPEMALAAVANLLGGFLYYLAALATGLAGRVSVMRRLLPLVVAMLGSSWLVEADYFSTAAWGTLFLAVLLGLSAWSALRHAQSPSRSPWMSRAGAVLVGFYAASAVGAFFSTLFVMAMPKTPYVSQRYETLADGAEVIVTRRNNITTAIDHLDGTPYTTDQSQFAKLTESTIGLSRVSSYIGEAHGWKPGQSRRYYRRAYTYLQELASAQVPVPQQWFWIRETRTAIGYELPAKQAIARFTPQGFVPVDDAKPFPEDMKVRGISGEQLLVTGPHLAAVASIVSRKMAVLTDDATQPVYGADDFYIPSSRGKRLFAVAFAGHLSIYEKNGTLLAQLPYTQDVSRWGRVSVGVNADQTRFYVGYNPSRFLPVSERRQMPTFVDQVTQEGEVLTSTRRLPLPKQTSSKPIYRYVLETFESPTYFFGTLLYQKIGGDLGDKRLAKLLRAALGPYWPSTRFKGILLVIASVLLAGLTWWLARRGELDRKAARNWALFVLLTNLPGLVAFWLLANWPPRAPCPSCGRLRRLDQPTCPHCGAGWENLPSHPAEIFDRPQEPNNATPASTS